MATFGYFGLPLATLVTYRRLLLATFGYFWLFTYLLPLWAILGYFWTLLAFGYREKQERMKRKQMQYTLESVSVSLLSTSWGSKGSNV